MTRWNLRFRSTPKRRNVVEEKNRVRSNDRKSDHESFHPNTDSSADQGKKSPFSKPKEHPHERIDNEIFSGCEISSQSFQSPCATDTDVGNPQRNSIGSSSDGFQVDQIAEENSTRRVEEHSLSYSFDSSFQSKSTMSMGSSLPQDSFVLASTTGLSSVSSPLSIYSFPLSESLNTVNEQENMEHKSRSKSVNRDHGHHQRHCCESRIATNRLPRLTIPSTHTQAYLQRDDNSAHRYQFNVGQVSKQKSKEIVKHSPQSSTTIDTEPSTPDEGLFHENTNHPSCNSEFPSISQDQTPQFNMSLNSSQEDIFSKDNFVNITDTRYTTPLLSKSESLVGNDFSNATVDYMIRANENLQNALTEKEFWTIKFQEAVNLHGEESLESARQLNNLGSSLLRCKEYTEAMVVFRKMIGILSRIHDDNSIAFARALDKVGFAASMSTSQQNLDWALLALKEALYLRFVHLGPHHTDTIDSLNNIAGVYLRMKKWAEAKEVYVDILTVRSAVFGPYHPSLAVTAQTLGKVCSHLSEFQSSLKYFQVALSIYREEPTVLKDSHPIIKRIYRNMDRTERLMISQGI